MSRHGRWLLLEAGILVVAAAVAASVHLSPLRIAIVMGGAFALVALLDLAVTRGRGSRLGSEPAPHGRPAPPRRALATARVDGARPARPAAAPAAAPRVKPAAPPPALERVAPASPAPLLATVGNGTSWNVWDLQRRARAVAGRNPLRDEEWAFLLLYLREFATADGLLPADFDRLVRTSFGELVGRK